MLKKFLKELHDNTDYVREVDGELVLKSKYKIGVIKLYKTNAQLELLSQKSQKIYVEFDSLNGAYNNDIVLVQVLFNPKGKTKAKVLKVLKSDDADILCYISQNELYSIKDNIKLSKNIEYKNYKNHDVLLIGRKNHIEHFGSLNDACVDEKISLYLYEEEYRLSTQYPQTKYTALESNRVDLTNLNFCTIDPVGAKDFDDAIYFDEATQELYVAIADVSSYVQEGSFIDEEAKKRGFSIYLPHKVLPMLPFELSNNLCSLVPNEDRLAFVFKMKLDVKKTKVISSELFEATINSKRRYTYEQIDEILEKSSDEYFIKLFSITSKFRKHRLKNGYDFRNEELRLRLDEEQNLEKTTTEESTPSHSLIEECMLLANQEAAKRLNQAGVFRVHDEPTHDNIIKLVDDVNTLGLKAKVKSDIHSTIISIQQKAKALGLEKEIDELIIQAQQQARYSNLKNQHFGLGFKDYSHFTSPIRRYADLVLHRILKTSSFPKDLEDTCVYLSDIERKIARLVWDYEDRKYARWAQQNIGESVWATLVDTDELICEVDDSIKGARVYIDNYKGEKLFTKVKVVLEKSDIVSKKITGKILR